MKVLTHLLGSFKPVSHQLQSLETPFHTCRLLLVGYPLYRENGHNQVLRGATLVFLADQLVNNQNKLD